MFTVHVMMAPNGRLVIPSRVRAQLGMQRGGAFVLHVEDGAIRLESLAAAIRRVQAEVRCYVPEDVDLAGELSEDRRREVVAADRGVAVTNIRPRP